jgi:hypothetical protein
MTCMPHGVRLLDYVEFPAPEVLAPGATEDEIPAPNPAPQAHIHKAPVSRGKKGKSGLIDEATDLKTAPALFRRPCQGEPRRL